MKKHIKSTLNEELEDRLGRLQSKEREAVYAAIKQRYERGVRFFMKTTLPEERSKQGDKQNATAKKVEMLKELNEKYKAGDS